MSWATNEADWTTEASARRSPSAGAFSPQVRAMSDATSV